MTQLEARIVGPKTPPSGEVPVEGGIEGAMFDIELGAFALNLELARRAKASGADPETVEELLDRADQAATDFMNAEGGF